MFYIQAKPLLGLSPRDLPSAFRSIKNELTCLHSREGFQHPFDHQVLIYELLNFSLRGYLLTMTETRILLRPVLIMCAE